MIKWFDEFMRQNPAAGYTVCMLYTIIMALAIRIGCQISDFGSATVGLVLKVLGALGFCALFFLVIAWICWGLSA